MLSDDAGKLNSLISGVAKGYGDCLDGIYAIAGGRMYAVAVGLVGRADAEDILHDSFIKIARFAKKYKAGDNPYGWLLMIVRNTALDYLRRKKARSEVCIDEVFNLSSSAYSPEKRENAIMLENAVKKLDRGEQLVIYYTYYEELTVREIATILDCGKSSVQRTLKRAEEKLKILLGGGTAD